MMMITMTMMMILINDVTLQLLMACYPVSKLITLDCCIADKGAELLVKHYPDQNSTGQLPEVTDFNDNDLIVDGLVHI